MVTCPREGRPGYATAGDSWLGAGIVAERWRNDKGFSFAKQTGAWIWNRPAVCPGKIAVRRGRTTRWRSPSSEMSVSEPSEVKPCPFHGSLLAIWAWGNVLQ